MAKKKIFISYDYDNDMKYKNMLLAWDANKEFDFSFYDTSVDVSIDSQDAAAIKRAISTRINDSDYLLCIVGKHTSKSSWVTWEINKAVELKKKLMAVKIEANNTSPYALLGKGASWAMSFTFESIRDALKSIAF
jgi:hypothetical protein